MVWVWLLLAIPVCTLVGISLVSRQRPVEWLHVGSAVLLLIFGTAVLYTVVTEGPVIGLYDYIHVDALSAFLLFVLTLVVFMTSIYAVGYMRFELEKRVITKKQFRRFFLSFHTFITTILLVFVLNNLALMWIAIELTTLASALLVAFYRKGRALEAAWKYLIIGSLGITFALFGIVFLYASGLSVFQEAESGFNWTTLVEMAPGLNPQWIAMAFVFVLVGFGTKAGFAPLHFWLPDAHSEAPSPVSAILSGALLNAALYGILRVYLIANVSLDGSANKWLLGFGLVSVALMVPFILVQHDYKRMLAYSSVEHIGIISFGVGIGGTLGLYGAMLHVFNHSVVKTLLFMSAGNMTQKYHSKRIDRISGVLKVMPITGAAFLIGVLAIAGSPPFNIFVSEWTIMLAGFVEKRFWSTGAFLVFILLIFAGMTYYTSQMVFGRVKNHIRPGEINHWSTGALFIPLAILLVFGLYLPPAFDEVLHQVIAVFEPIPLKEVSAQ